MFLPWLACSSEIHTDTESWSNQERTKAKDRAVGISRLKTIDSVHPVQPNLRHDLDPPTDPNPEIRAKGHTDCGACQLSLGSKRSQVSKVHVLRLGFWNRCALQRIFPNDARANDHTNTDWSNRWGVKVEQSREDEISVLVVR